ncbi:MAG: thioesterase domain-containing protein, partial [Acidimicrobiales bacterium]
PARTVVMDAMPLTRSGKVDRVALEEPSEAASEQRPITDPRTARMTELWRRTLGVATLGADEDFFSRGGNSLLAMELLARIDDEYGVQLPLSAMFDARTPRMCIDLVDREVVEPPEVPDQASPSKYLVKLRDGDVGADAPLWLVHPAGGSLVLYEPLVGHLEEPRSVFGVEAVGVDGIEQPLEEVVALADHQLATILSTQSEGPYRILGYSVGGIVALEICRQLIAMGHEVEFLGAVEAGVPIVMPAPETRRTKYTRLARELDVRGTVRNVAASVRRRREDFATYVSEKGTTAATHRQVAEAMARAYHRYQAEPVDVAVTLFFGNDTSSYAMERLTERWSGLAAGGAQVRRVSGSHSDDLVLREPHAKRLAIALEEELAASARQRPG